MSTSNILEIERYSDTMVEIYDSNKHRICVCHNEVEFRRALVLIARENIQGLYAEYTKNDILYRTNIDRDGFVERWDDLYCETDDVTAEHIKICGMKRRMRNEA